MSMDDRKRVAAWVTAIVGVLSLVTCGVVKAGNADAEPYCYEALAAYASWPELKPMLKDALKDRKFSIRECKKATNAYEKARSQEVREKQLKDYDDNIK